MRLRERLAVRGRSCPRRIVEAIDEIAEHLNDLHRAAIATARRRPRPTRSSKPSWRGWDRWRSRSPSARGDARRDATAAGLADRPRRRFPSRDSRPSPQSQLLGDRHSDAGDRHRRLHRRLQHRQCAAAGIAAVSASASTRHCCGRPTRTTAIGRSSSRSRSTKTGSAKRGASRRWASGSTAPTTSRRRRSPNRCRASARPPSLFTVLGVPPALGRVFTEEEEKPGHRVVVISDGVWRKHFGGTALGDRRIDSTQRRAVRSDRRHAEGFRVPVAEQRRVGARLRSTNGRTSERGSHSFCVAGRLKPEVTFEQARADVEQVGRALQQTLRREPRRRLDHHDDGRDRARHAADDADGADGRGRAGPAHRLRQRREPAAWVARWRGGASSRCGSRSAPASAASRGSCSRNRWCSPSPAALGGVALAWMRDAGSGSRADARIPRAALPRRSADRDRRARAAVRGGRGDRVGGAVRIRAAPRPAAPRIRSAAARRRARLDRRRQRRAPIARGDRSRAGDRRAVRRRPAGQEPVGPDAGQPGLDPQRGADAAGVAAAGRHLRAAGARILLRRPVAKRRGSARHSQDRRDQPPAAERRQCRPRA